jgi:hypothetical protein
VPGPPATAPTGNRSNLIPVGAQRARPGGEALPIVNLYDARGGQAFFDELVERVYRGVEADLVLRPLYPDHASESEPRSTDWVGLSGVAYPRKSLPELGR